MRHRLTAAVSICFLFVPGAFALAGTDPRGEERTYASYPEWYIVYSAQEYAAHVQRGAMPSTFPYFAVTSQYWDSVSSVQSTLGTTTLDSNTKTVLRFIGASFTVENLLIGVYEKTVGRISELLNFNYKTTEDLYTDAVAREYGIFLEHTPWYAFPYFSKLGGLWSTYGWSSLTPRGIERRLIFTVGYAVKGIYGAAMGALSRSSLGTAELTTRFVVENISSEDLGAIAGVVVDSVRPTGSIEATAPRYSAFTDVAVRIANAGGNFVSIQGHDTIMSTIVANDDQSCFYEFPILKDRAFAMPVLTEDHVWRSIFVSPVSQLAERIRELRTCGLPIEHIYDY